MIGHFLLTLKPEEEDRVLTQPMVGQGLNGTNSTGCLVQVAWDYAGDLCTLSVIGRPLEPYRGALLATERWVPGRYDELCERFGEARVNAAIRNRILANRVARTVPIEVPA